MSDRHRSLYAALLVLASISACGGAAATPPDAGAEVAAGPCNEIMIPAADVTIQRQAGTPPEPAGGMIVDGTYVLTATDDYEPGDALAGQSTSAVMVVSDGSIQFASNGAKGGQIRFNASYTLSSTGIEQTGTCGLTQPLSEGYTSTPTTITLIQSSPTFVSVFERM
jgi:hypothetical protein